MGMILEPLPISRRRPYHLNRRTSPQGNRSESCHHAMLQNIQEGNGGNSTSGSSTPLKIAIWSLTDIDDVLNEIVMIEHVTDQKRPLRYNTRRGTLQYREYYRTFTYTYWNRACLSGSSPDTGERKLQSHLALDSRSTSAMHRNVST